MAWAARGLAGARAGVCTRPRQHCPALQLEGREAALLLMRHWIPFTCFSREALVPARWMDLGAPSPRGPGKHKAEWLL